MKSLDMCVSDVILYIAGFVAVYHERIELAFIIMCALHLCSIDRRLKKMEVGGGG